MLREQDSTILAPVSNPDFGAECQSFGRAAHPLGKSDRPELESMYIYEIYNDMAGCSASGHNYPSENISHLRGLINTLDSARDTCL